MPTNRVEELEATVAELESTVRGLTEELVETKERVRILEAELDADPQAVVEDAETNVDLAGESDAQADARVEVADGESDRTEIVTPEPGESGGSDLDEADDELSQAAVSEAGPEDVEAATKAAAEDVVEGDKRTESESGDDAEESESGDDIIVA